METVRFQELFCSIPKILFVEPFGTISAIVGASWDPAGRQGVPKINNFGAKSRQNVKIKSIMRQQKKYEFLSICYKKDAGF